MPILNHSPMIARSALLAVLAVTAVPAGAASHCQGLTESACGGDATCTWIQGYVRKDGRQVSSHCKLARGKQAVSVSASRIASPKR